MRDRRTRPSRGLIGIDLGSIPGGETGTGKEVIATDRNRSRGSNGIPQGPRLAGQHSRAAEFHRESRRDVARTRPASITKTDSVAATRTLGAAQRDHILEVLDQTRWLIGGNEGAAARLAGT